MYSVRIAIVTLLCVVASSMPCFSARPVRTVKRDIPYKTEGDAYELERCKMDLWRPVDRGDETPVLLWMHGGGLTGGDKGLEFAENVAKAFTLQGFAVASINYRLSPKAKYPAYIDDVAAAISWLHKNVDQHRGSPDKIFVAGHSAGAYLSAMVSLDPKYLKKYDLTPAMICGAIPVSPQVDSHWTVRDERGIPRSQRVIDESAPLFHAKPDAPAMLNFCGSNDLEGRADRNQVFADAMKKAGHKDMTYKIIEGRDHGTIISKCLEKDDEVARDIIKFIRSHVPQPVGR